MSFILPVYSGAGLRALTGPLAPWVGPQETLMVVSGNVARPLERPWVEEALARLAAAFPANPKVVATAGLAHVAQLAGLGLPVVYIYEPNFPNVPEFTWDFRGTLANVARAAQAVPEPLGFKPTGRPLLQKGRLEHGWDYGAFAARGPLFAQTQTYCARGDFAAAAAKLAQSCAPHVWRTCAQVTVDPAARNGVAPARAAGCARAALARGLAGVTVWWSPRAPGAVAAFMQAFGAPAG